MPIFTNTIGKEFFGLQVILQEVVVEHLSVLSGNISNSRNHLTDWLRQCRLYPPPEGRGFTRLLIKNINPDIDLGDDSKPKIFVHEREMKLLGFTDKTISALRGQYSDAQIARALDAVMEKGGANPKMAFINELEEHGNG